MHTAFYKMQLIVLISFLLVSACATNGSKTDHNKVASSSPETECEGTQITKQTPNTSTPALVTSKHRLYSQGCFESILSQLLEKSNKPFVLFVSGRGQHPSKAIKKKNMLLPKLEEQYGVTAVMFTWPSWCGPRCFPRDKAHESGAALLDILRIIAQLKEKDVHSRPYSLLSHSMGALVLEGLADLQINDLPTNLFDNIIISAAAAPQKDHRSWVENITFGTQLYITANYNDNALRCLESDVNGIGPRKIFCSKFKLPARLGRWGVEKATIDNTSSNALYLDFTKGVGEAHRYYINQHSKAPNVFNFYELVFQGHSTQLANFDEIISNRVYKLRR